LPRDVLFVHAAGQSPPRCRLRPRRTARRPHLKGFARSPTYLSAPPPARLSFAQRNDEASRGASHADQKASHGDQKASSRCHNLEVVIHCRRDASRGASHADQKASHRDQQVSPRYHGVTGVSWSRGIQ
jgi:hypothetical protein